MTTNHTSPSDPKGRSRQTHASPFSGRKAKFFRAVNYQTGQAALIGATIEETAVDFERRYSAKPTSVVCATTREYTTELRETTDVSTTISALDVTLIGAGKPPHNRRAALPRRRTDD